MHEIVWTQPVPCSCDRNISKNVHANHLTIDATSPQSTEKRTLSDQPTTKGRNIFIDGGANRGDTFFLLLQNDTFFSPDIMRRDIDVYLFEASPIWTDLLRELYSKYPQIKGVYYETAIWNNSKETLTLFINKNHEASSAFNKPKVGGRATVRCIEICEWMMQIMGFRLEDYIIFKLDVEGAEYPILYYIMQHQECMDLIDELWIEWHPWGQQDYLPPDHQRGPGTWLNLPQNWTTKLQHAGVQVETWH